MAAKSRMFPFAAPAGIGLLALGAAVVVLVAGGPDRWAVVAGLLVVVAFAVAAGGALDELRRAEPRISPPTPATPGRPPLSPAVRASLAVAKALQLLPILVAAALAGLAVKAWLNGDVVLGSLALVAAAIAAWRGWQALRHLTGRA